MDYQLDCRLFTGYKPCRYKRVCDRTCPHYDRVDSRILIISLDAMGAVLRSTSLLPQIKRKHPGCHITWLTLTRAAPLLQENPYIDRVLKVGPSTTAVLSTLEFSVLYAVDKSIDSGAFAEIARAEKKFGFGLDQSGSIRPFTQHADYQFSLGLDNDKKFFQNSQTETEQLSRSMDLDWQRDPYVLQLSSEEQQTVIEKRDRLLSYSSSQGAWVLGYNTGCSNDFAYKKFTLPRAIQTIKAWRKHFPEAVIALCGGPEDTERQQKMKMAFAEDAQVVNTSTTLGLREGIAWLAAADIVFTGCSLGMHISIGLQKPVLAWFGLSCAHEIDLYGRGLKLKADVSCSPCWQKSCHNTPKCYDMVDPRKIVEATLRLKQKYLRTAHSNFEPELQAGP